MYPPFKAVVVTVLAGWIAQSLAGCSKDFPVEPPGHENAPGQAASVTSTAANDNFSNAIVINTLPFTHRVNTSDATTEPDEPLNDETCGFGSIGGHTVWYQFTPAQDMRVNVSTVGSDFDPNVFAYTGSPGNLTRVSCNFLPASMTFQAEGGQTYFIVAGSFDGAPGGNLVLSVDLSLEVDITIDRVGRINRSTGLVTISGRMICSRSAHFEVQGTVEQRGVQGFFFAQENCTGVTRWEAEAVAETRKFKPGAVQVSATGFVIANATTEERNAGEVSATVRLRPAK